MCWRVGVLACWRVGVLACWRESKTSMLNGYKVKLATARFFYPVNKCLQYRDGDNVDMRECQ